MQGGSSDSRSTFAIILIMVVAFFGWQYYLQKSPKPVTPSAAAPAASAPASPSAPAANAPAATPGNAASAAPTAPVVAASAESQTIVENELYRITFTNRGAHVTSWLLKKYNDDNGHPLDLVNPDVAKKFGYPLSLFTYDANLTSRIEGGLYQPSATGTVSSTTADGATLDYKFADGAGLVVHKIFHFDATYILHADITVTQNGVPVRALLNWPSGLGDQNGDYTGSAQAVHPATSRRGTAALSHVDTSRGGKTVHLDGRKVSGGATAEGELDWAGVSNLYFAAIFLPDQPQTASLVTENNTVYVALDPSKPDAKSPTALLGTALGDTSGHTSLRLYAGPNDIYVLSNIHATSDPHVTLEPVVDFGWLSYLSKFLFILLHWTYEHVLASWGWSIVLLTVFINLVFLPLRISSMKSALKMQRIQPQITAIRDKYKKYKVTDPQYANMNTEISSLYQKENVNMFGGCLPLLVQMPLLFAFYGMLSHAIELRQAHWFWLPDLSSADPYHILPCLMIASQFLVQFYTPSPGMDPQQARMMAFTMPAFTGFITWNYASGLALYWAVGNIIGIAQQLVMNNTKLGREMREIAAKRARRKPKTIQARR
jgi:YidC/Oxa1 family membrane protein insertase